MADFLREPITRRTMNRKFYAIPENSGNWSIPGMRLSVRPGDCWFAGQANARSWNKFLVSLSSNSMLDTSSYPHRLSSFPSHWARDNWCGLFKCRPHTLAAGRSKHFIKWHPISYKEEVNGLVFNLWPYFTNRPRTRACEVFDQAICGHRQTS